MPVTISLVRKRVGFASGGGRLITGTVDHRDRGISASQAQKIYNRERVLVYRDEESETAQVQNVGSFLCIFLKYSNVRTLQR